jgi:hypothetical protein
MQRIIYESERMEQKANRIRLEAKVIRESLRHEERKRDSEIKRKDKVSTDMNSFRILVQCIVFSCETDVFILSLSLHLFCYSCVFTCKGTFRRP